MSASREQGPAGDSSCIKSAMNAAGIGLWRFDVSSNKIIPDDICCALHGLGCGASIGYDEMAKLVDPDDYTSLDEAIWAASQGEADGRFDVTYRLSRPDEDDMRWINVAGAAFFDGNGQLSGITGVAQDVSELQRARLQYKENHQQVLLLFDQSLVAAATITKEKLTYTRANATYAELVGRTVDQLVGHPLLQVFPELEGHGFDYLLNAVINTGEPFAAREQAIGFVRDGVKTISFIDFSYQPLRDSRGAIDAILVTAIDVTQQVVMRKKLEETEQTLASAIGLAELGSWFIDIRENKAIYSDRVASWFGVPSGSPLADVLGAVPAGDALRMQEAISKAIQSGEGGVIDIEHTVINSQTGETRIIHSRGNVRLDDEGTVQTLVGTSRDVTPKR